MSKPSTHKTANEDDTHASDGRSAKKTLSLCMIVKNEERFIANCLESVKSIVDEMMIVDTGSTDTTKDICQQFGATVLDYKWNDDFSAARNFGLHHVTGDWILWLDADEVMEKEDLPALHDALHRTDQKCFSIHLINYYGESANIDESFHIAHLRLFRNHMGINFEGKVHEHLTIENVDRMMDIPVRVYHYGYMSNVAQERGKSQRNIRMLKNELHHRHHSPWIHYHLASELFNNQEYEAAFQQVNEAILRFILQGLKPPALAYRLKYLTLINHGSVDGALAGIDKAIQMYPDYVDLYFFKGMLLYTTKDYEEALDVFKHCTSLGEGNWSYLTMTGAGSFHAWFYVGKCLQELGASSSAKEAYETSLKLSPSFHPAVEALDTLRKE